MEIDRVIARIKETAKIKYVNFLGFWGYDKKFRLYTSGPYKTKALWSIDIRQQGLDKDEICVQIKDIQRVKEIMAADLFLNIKGDGWDKEALIDLKKEGYSNEALMKLKRRQQ